MQDPIVWNNILKHLTEEETTKEKDQFLQWYDKSEKNKALFDKLKSVWDGKDITNASQQNVPLTFFGRFNKEKMKSFIYNQSIGNLIGFVVGMWVTSSFSHYVLERRGLKNLFGLAGRKKVAVNEIPEWLQSGIAILIGFITLELINHFFQTKKHIIIWNYLKKVTGNKNQS